jgi:hypothetical protein
MRRIVLYLILAGSVTVLAQLQIQDMVNSGNASGQAKQAENKPGDEATPTEGQSDSVADEPDDSNAFGEKSASTDDEKASKNENVIEVADEVEDSAPSDEDFKPDEEMSEDYPVPLPSDI